ncbi:cyclic nucleotide-binding protein (macronuclear) [Tetrahymena thermophila SB210]|uniref:Cyclic nucleotide-binding protein n=1 Tax=Tetrahymena thermophila (strain SB210) TaxID=312017 RepID=I7ML16_TETTS|nr:cyclic nucleotide-binding protein [Tetrahymena thermophila SB210]EAS00872.2 cyclic nucleotide-binding protein [Tetrahymena thermophila SB210]|eukprot:XP_001021117.2 cyclic nucleotide-binding protein [Tetrahymena thermophila SB210]
MQLFRQAKSDYSQEGKEVLASPITAKDYPIDNTYSSNLLKNQTLSATVKQKNGSPNLGAQKQSTFKTSLKSNESKGLSSVVKKSRKWDAIKDVYNAQKFQIAALKTLFKRLETYQKGSDKSQALQIKKRDLIYIDPDNSLYFIWKCITGIAMLYYPIMIPIRNCFELNNYDHIVYDYFLDGLFLIDIFLNFITGRIEEGVKIQNVGKISKLYLKQEFIYDIIAIFPWQKLEKKTTSFGFILLKLLRLRYRSRFIEFLRSFIFKIFGSGKNIQYALLTYNILIILSQVLFCIHMLNCIWITLGKFNDGKTSWIQLVIQGDENIENYIKTLYTNGFYYIVTTISTVGYGDISCQTSYEMFFACLCMFFGIALFGYIQGGLVDAIKHSLLSGEIKQSNDENEFQTWLIQREQNIEYPLSSKKLKTMRECFQFSSKYEFSNTVLESEYFQDLPPLDQAKVFVFYFSEFVTVYSTFFRNISDVSLTRQIIGALKPVYIPKDTIVQGYLCNSNGIYFIFKGQIIVQKVIEVNDKLELLPFRELTHGSFIGENCLLKKSSRFNYVVDQDTDLYCFFISSEQIYQILEDYPFVFQQLVKFASFRNKFFKLEGEKVEQQNQIYKTTHQPRKSFFRKQTEKNFEKQMTQHIELNAIKETTNNNSDEEIESVQSEDDNQDVQVGNKMQLLYQFEKNSEDQKQQIFTEIQSENIITNLFKQMNIFSQTFKHKRHSNIQNQQIQNNDQKSITKKQGMFDEFQKEKQSNDSKSPQQDYSQLPKSELGGSSPNQQANQNDTNCQLAQINLSINPHQNYETLIKSQISQNKSDNQDTLRQNLIREDSIFSDMSDKSSLPNQIRYDLKKTKQSLFKQSEKKVNSFQNVKHMKSSSYSQINIQKQIKKQTLKKNKSMYILGKQIPFIYQIDFLNNQKINNPLNQNEEQTKEAKQSINQVRYFEVNPNRKDSSKNSYYDSQNQNNKIQFQNNNLTDSSKIDAQEKLKDEILFTEQSLKSELIPKTKIQSQQTEKSVQEVELINLESINDQTESDLEDLQIKQQNLSYFKQEKSTYIKKFLQNLNNQENNSMQDQNKNELDSMPQEQLIQNSTIQQINERGSIVQQKNLQKDYQLLQSKQIEQDLSKLNWCQNFSKSSSQINQQQAAEKQPSTQIEQLNSQQYLKNIDKSKNILDINLITQDCEKEQDQLLFRKIETLYQPQSRQNNHKNSGELIETTTQNNSENNSVKNIKRNQTIGQNTHKKYQSDKKVASNNKKKIYQSQIQGIMKQAEIETMSYRSRNESKFQQNENQQSMNQNQINLNQNQRNRNKSNFVKQINVDQNQNSQSPNNIKQSSPRNNKKKLNSNKHARKVSNEILTPLNQYQYKGGNKSFTVLLSQNQHENNTQEHLSNFKALIQIMNVVRNSKPNEKQEQNDNAIYQKEENTFSNDQNIDLKLSAYVQTDIDEEEEEKKYVENILDKSIDVPIGLIEPSFTTEELDNIFPYLKSTVTRLDRRADDLFKSINEFKVFCLEKVQKIKSLKKAKSAKSSQKNIPNQDKKDCKQVLQTQILFQKVTFQ